nr:MAG TPA: baseplate protein [Bacteriophage sp.]
MTEQSYDLKYTGKEIDDLLDKANDMDSSAQVPAGGTSGQVLTKKSGTDFDAQWETPGVALPTGGTAEQILTKNSDTDGDASWKDAPIALPAGGTSRQVLAKKTDTNYDTEWINALPYVPIGGIIIWNGTGLTGAPDLSTPEKVASFYGYGTWEQLTDCMLRAADDTHPAGSTGGTWEVVQTVEQMPKHTHSYPSYQSGYPAQHSEDSLYITPVGRKPYSDVNYSAVRTTSTGTGKPMPIVNKYTAVYMYRRTG